MFRPTELSHFLTSIGAKANKNLSQNFLVDGNILKKIIALAEVKEVDHILEIGPGPGALTEALLEAGAFVTAVEKDRLFGANLIRLQTPDNRLKVFQQDIRSFDLDLVKGKVVANLPYHLTAPILDLLVPRNDLFSKVVIMVQHEVALRMTAEPDSEHYSALSLFLQFYSTPSYGFKVSRHSFLPVPQVDSAVVVLDLKKAQEVDKESFFAMTRQAFQQRRKMLSSSLQSYGKERVREALSSLSLDRGARPGVLSLEQWLLLYRLLTKEQTAPKITSE